MQRTSNAPDQTSKRSLRERLLSWAGAREDTGREDKVRRALESAVGRMA
jgi:hypothetical protein